MVWVYSILCSVLVSIVSLVGIFALFINQEKLKGSLQFLVSLAVGVLLGDAFLHLIPDAIKRTGNVEMVLLVTIIGILLFFFLEKVVRWQHQHETFDLKNIPKTKPLARMNLIGDAVHNFIDGTLIGGSFLISPALGITTTIAIIIHEIPQEIGDIGALVYGGYTPKKAVLYNFLCSLTCILGAVVILIFGSIVELPVIYMLPIAAGGFIYIASSDFIPELHNKSAFTHQMVQGLMISIGVASMLAITIVEKMIKV